MRALLAALDRVEGRLRLSLPLPVLLEHPRASYEDLAFILGVFSLVVDKPLGVGSTEVVSKARVPVISSGGISTLEHLSRLRALDVEGAIVGRALYTGDIDLAEAIRASAQREESCDKE